jgi:hypothetical protein
VFKRSDKIQKWFRLDAKKIIKALPEPERDLKVYFSLVCWNQYQAKRAGAKAEPEEWSNISESESENDDDEWQEWMREFAHLGVLGNDSKNDKEDIADESDKASNHSNATINIGSNTSSEGSDSSSDSSSDDDSPSSPSESDDHVSPPPPKKSRKHMHGRRKHPCAKSGTTAGRKKSQIAKENSSLAQRKLTTNDIYIVIDSDNEKSGTAGRKESQIANEKSSLTRNTLTSNDICIVSDSDDEDPLIGSQLMRMKPNSRIGQSRILYSSDSEDDIPLSQIAKEQQCGAGKKKKADRILDKTTSISVNHEVPLQTLRTMNNNVNKYYSKRQTTNKQAFDAR